MPVTLIIGTAIVVASCAAFVAVGAAYRWDVTAPAYGRWIRGIGAVALLGITGLGAWDRRDEPFVATVVAVLGVALSAAFVIVHARLSAMVRDRSS
jgi:hypothetical protein